MLLFTTVEEKYMGNLLEKAQEILHSKYGDGVQAWFWKDLNLKRKIIGAFRKHSNNNTNIDNSHIEKVSKSNTLVALLRTYSEDNWHYRVGMMNLFQGKRKSLVELNLQGCIFIFPRIRKIVF